MECWICGQPGTTGEHLIKASDLKSYFGTVSQQKPIYQNSEARKNLSIGSIKASSKLKSAARLCAKCNNQRTSAHDKAWSKLSSYLQDNLRTISKSGEVKLDKVFPGSIARDMKLVQLFFVKHFGCRVISDGVPINLESLSQAILNETEHPNVYISFLNVSAQLKHKYAGLTPIKAVNINGVSVFCSCAYIVGNLAVNIIYCTVENNQKVLKGAKKPSEMNKALSLGVL
ncbi:hypothetical protein [uncultured Halopseudomonas sp.]|uniref:hypothetical protein n=1 Tax=uncultured Halopseudomonas sp. TaxID=2901193 RepID=UPI0030EB8BCA